MFKEERWLTIISILLVTLVIGSLITAVITEHEHAKAKQKLCVQQYGDKARYTEIDYGKYGITIDYCIIGNSELKMLKEK